MLTRGRTDRGGLSFCPIPFAGLTDPTISGLGRHVHSLWNMTHQRQFLSLCHVAAVIGVRAVLVGELVGPHWSVASSRRLRGAKRPKLANIRTNQEARRATKAFGVPAPLFYRRPSRAPHSRRRFGG